MGRALFSVGRLNDAGCDVILNKLRPRIVTKSGQVLKLKKKGGVYILTMWVKVPQKDKKEERGGENSGDKDKSGFARQER